MKKENRTTALHEIPLEIMDQISDEPQIFSLPHWHELIEIIYIEEGELLLQLGERNLIITSGEVCVINQYGIHSTRAEKRIRGFVIFFLPTLLLNNSRGSEDEEMLKSLICGDKSLILAPESSGKYSEAIAYLGSIYRNYFTNEKGRTLFTRANLYNFFALLLSSPFLFNEISNPNYRIQRERLDKILEIIDNRGTESITLSDIAKELNLSTYRFCHVFRELTGYTFSQYLIRYRLFKAQEMLVGADRPIIEIAMSCGFNSVNYFNRVFKKIIGYTPRAYRRKYRTSI